MTRATVVIVPLDDRSVNYECLLMLGEAAGFDVLLPPKAWLGTPWRAGKTEELGAWVEEQAARADALVVAVVGEPDMSEKPLPPVIEGVAAPTGPDEAFH